MNEEDLLILFNKGYPERLVKSKIDITDERTVCNLFKMFVWGYRLAEKHFNASLIDMEYCLNEYAEELEGYSLTLLDVLEYDIRGGDYISSKQVRHFANSSYRLAEALLSYISEEISPKKEPTLTDKEE